MYIYSVIGFGFGMDGFKLFAYVEAKAFKAKLCVHTSALPDTQGVSSGRFQPGKLDGLFIKCCSLLWTDCTFHHMLSHASLIHIQKRHLLVCKLGIHIASHPPESCQLTGRKKVASSWPQDQNKASFGDPKTGSGFLPGLICWATWWTQFWVRILTPEMGPQNAKKKAPAFCLRCAILRRIPQRARHRFVQWLTERLLGMPISSLEPWSSCSP